MMKYWALALVIAWAASIMLPVATFGPEEDATWQGWAMLMLGWIGLLIGQPGWLANVGFALCLVFMLRQRPPGRWGMAVGLVTAGLALHSLTWTWVFANEGPKAVPSPITAYHVGYWLWIATTTAAGALLFASALAVRPRVLTAR